MFLSEKFRVFRATILDKFPRLALVENELDSSRAIANFLIRGTIVQMSGPTTFLTVRHVRNSLPPRLQC